MTVEVRFLGTGDAFGDGDRFQACIWLRSNDSQAILDCGGTSLQAMKKFGVEPNDIDVVLISHFHGDHDGGLPYLILDGQFRKRTGPLTIAGPRGIEERTRAAMQVAFAGSSSTSQRFAVHYKELSSVAMEIGPFAVSALPVRHTPGSEALALRTVVNGKSVAYSGDTEWTQALAEVSDSADLFICEAYSFGKRIPYHLAHRDLVEHANEISARRIVLTHFGPEILGRLAESRFEVAHDGLRADLS